MLQRNYSNFPLTEFGTNPLQGVTHQQSQQPHLSSSQMIMTRRLEAAKHRAQQLHVAAEGRGTPRVVVYFPRMKHTCVS